MNAVIDYIQAHPLILIVTGAVFFVLILFYLLKNFAKLTLIAVLGILAGLIGYHFYTSEGSFNDRMKSALLETKEQVSSYVEKGKAVFDFGKKIVSPERESKGTDTPIRKKKLEDI